MASVSDVLIFKDSEPFTLGVELELQLIDKNSLDLTPRSPDVFEALGGESKRIKAEIFQSMLEINTNICRNAHDVRSDLAKSITQLRKVCNPLGIELASAGTHPFADYADRDPYPAKRYTELINRTQWIARRLIIFGLHVHIGMRNGEHAIQINNALLHALPVLLALSASSPFWNGEDTALASSRITFFEAIPTGGHPCRVKSWDDFLTLYAKLLKSGAIGSHKDLWWDVRPSPGFGTLEIRICDSPATLEEIVAITAFLHALAIDLDEQISKGKTFTSPPDWVMRENKWRASRWGVDAELVVSDDGDKESFASIVDKMLTQIEPTTLKLGYKNEMDLIRRLVRDGPSYKRQRAIAAKNGGSMLAVTDLLIREFETGFPQWLEIGKTTGPEMTVALR